MLLPPITRSFSFHSRFRRLIWSKCRNSQMGPENLSLIDKRHRASFRLCNVSGYKTDLLEIYAKDPKFHVLFIPGNPGVISFYVDFLESLYDLLGGAASVTAISHIGQTEKNFSVDFGENTQNWLTRSDRDPTPIPTSCQHGCGTESEESEQLSYEGLSHVSQPTCALTKLCLVEHRQAYLIYLATYVISANEAIYSIEVAQLTRSWNRNWEHGRLFSLQEQTDHKLNFIEHELQDVEVPLVLVGHSIGSYISLDIVTYCICLYPFLAVNTKSSTQAIIKKIAVSRTLCTGLSSLAAILALLPAWISRFLVKKSVGKSWSPPAVEALCKHVLRYHTIQNILYMAMTEFEKLSEVPDWSFMREKKSQMAFLFGVDDHWGPLHIYEEISNNVPGAVLTVEQGGYTHAFSCTEAGSLWVAQHVSGLIKNYLSK
uniref:Lipid droplet-associated hydrolase n=1 Tax=Nicotiana tabacum TaxID=4097 RepID=A0A1S4ACQ7_TOBAC|nr:PREDICTED: uncharacterized protein LOC107796108 [Nicotiana tabacum]